MAEFKEHQKCLISDSVILKPLKGYEQHYLVKSSPLGFVFCSRIPTTQELIVHYETTYSRNDYLSDITVKRYHELLDGFEPYKRTGKLLDIGSGIGHFLNEAKKRGWEVYGTEYTDEAIQKCEALGIRMQQGKLDPSWYEESSFDVVTSIEVLEHINNPVEEIRNISRILRPGGLFYFTTPNFNSIERYLVKSEYNVIHYPEHLSYYTKRTVDYLLRNNGFKKLRLLTTGVSLTRIKTSLGKSQEDYVSPTSSDEKLRTELEKNRFLQFTKTLLNGILNITAFGSSLKGWYINNKNA
jgi:2-polyprenyl-3-methyl-5-hydroxy-6-metoxy-1,4-benzoquinol methylase